METGQYRLRKAAAEEVPAIWEIILQAKAQMYREGKHQWDENYPTVPILENDVRRGWGYVLVPDNCRTQPEPNIIAYGAVVFDGEPAYDGLRDGKWLSGHPYVVLHRLAVADSWKRQGMAVRYMQAVCDLAISAASAASRSTPTTTTSTCSASSPASASPTAAASGMRPASAWHMRNCCSFPV